MNDLIGRGTFGSRRAFKEIGWGLQASRFFHSVQRVRKTGADFK